MLPIPATTCWSSSNGFSARDVGPNAARSAADVERIRDRIDAEPRQFGKLRLDVRRVEHHDLAERARIDEPGFEPVVEMGDDVGVRATGSAACSEQHLAAHPEMDHGRLARVEREQQVLATALGAITTVSVSPAITASREVRRTVRSRPTSTPTMRRPTR
jgi:hypothetical protein